MKYIAIHKYDGNSHPSKNGGYYTIYSIVVGSAPFGPRGGRNGKIKDGKIIKSFKEFHSSKGKEKAEAYAKKLSTKKNHILLKSYDDFKSIKNVELAFNSYSKGKRPEKYKNAKTWYVFDHNRNLYPAKIIWTLATNKNDTGYYHTHKVKRELESLGYELVNTNKQKNEIKKFEKKVIKSLSDSSEKRKSRLKKAIKKPKTTYSINKTFIRNPDVVAEVLHRANGKCEKCKNNAPFKRASDGTPYLEVHHKIGLAKGGDDTIENSIALCPNCHREAHFG